MSSGAFRRALEELEGSSSFELIEIEAFLLQCGYTRNDEDPDVVLFTHNYWRGPGKRLTFVRGRTYIPAGYVRDALKWIRNHLTTEGRV